MKTNFTKSDLKSGMAVKLRSGIIGVVIDEKYFCLVDGEGFSELEYYNDDLTEINRIFYDDDIVAVGDYVKGLDKEHIEMALVNPIWERKPTPATTPPDKEIEPITLQEFISYVETYAAYQNNIKKVAEILFVDPMVMPPIPYIDDFEVEYIKMVAKLLGIKDEEMVDELINWFYVDECGKDSSPISFNRKQLAPDEVYEKVTKI